MFRLCYLVSNGDLQIRKKFGYSLKAQNNNNNKKNRNQTINYELTIIN